MNVGFYHPVQVVPIVGSTSSLLSVGHTARNCLAVLKNLMVYFCTNGFLRLLNSLSVHVFQRRKRVIYASTLAFKQLDMACIFH